MITEILFFLLVAFSLESNEILTFHLFSATSHCLLRRSNKQETKTLRTNNCGKWKWER
jgi:hypothetical protein